MYDDDKHGSKSDLDGRDSPTFLDISNSKSTSFAQIKTGTFCLFHLRFRTGTICLKTLQVQIYLFCALHCCAEWHYSNILQYKENDTPIQAVLVINNPSSLIEFQLNVPLWTDFEYLLSKRSSHLLKSDLVLDLCIRNKEKKYNKNVYCMDWFVVIRKQILYRTRPWHSHELDTEASRTLVSERDSRLDLFCSKYNRCGPDYHQRWRVPEYHWTRIV